MKNDQSLTTNTQLRGVFRRVFRGLSEPMTKSSVVTAKSLDRDLVLSPGGSRKKRTHEHGAQT